MSLTVSLPSSSVRYGRPTVTPAPDAHNSPVLWHRTVAPWRVLRNGLFIRVARHSPSLALKRWLYRRLGKQVGDHAAMPGRSHPTCFSPN